MNDSMKHELARVLEAEKALRESPAFLRPWGPAAPAPFDEDITTRSRFRLGRNSVEVCNVYGPTSPTGAFGEGPPRWNWKVRLDGLFMFGVTYTVTYTGRAHSMEQAMVACDNFAQLSGASLLTPQDGVPPVGELGFEND